MRPPGAPRDRTTVSRVPIRCTKVASNDVDTDSLIFIVGPQSSQGLARVEERSPAAGDDAFLDCGAGRVHRVVNAVLALLHLDFRGAANANDGNKRNHEDNRSDHQAVQARRRQGGASRRRRPRDDHHRGEGLRPAEAHVELYRGAEYTVDFVPKVVVEVVIDDALVERAVEAIQHAARTDTIGDGKILISTISEAIRIRIGEKGTDALYSFGSRADRTSRVREKMSAG
jgi:nitrogen regulatory protein P-II 1